MDIDFALVLLVLSAVTGFIWLADAIFLASPRRHKVQSFLNTSGISKNKYQAFHDCLDEQGRYQVPKKGAEVAFRTDAASLKRLEQAAAIHRDPVVVEYAKSFFPILFAVLLLRSFLFEPFQIPTGSMIPTLNIGDFIVVNKYAYGIRLPVVGTKLIDVNEPKRGDIMVFVPPHRPDYYIKRVIGLPGDHIQYRDKTIYVNGEALPQERVELLREVGRDIVLSRETINGIEHDIHTFANYGNSSWPWMPPEGITVPAGHYFMMGDNRDNSSDSREWGFASEENIVGKAVAVWMHKEPGWKLPTFAQNRFIKNPD